MKAFIASYYKSYGYGAYDDFKLIVIAETEQVALGLSLEAKPETTAPYWTFSEVPLTVAAAYDVYEN